MTTYSGNRNVYQRPRKKKLMKSEKISRHFRTNSMLKYPFADNSATMTDILENQVESLVLQSLTPTGKKFAMMKVFKELSVGKDRLRILDIPLAFKVSISMYEDINKNDILYYTLKGIRSPSKSQ